MRRSPTALPITCTLLAFATLACQSESSPSPSTPTTTAKADKPSAPPPKVATNVKPAKPADLATGDQPKPTPPKAEPAKPAAPPEPVAKAPPAPVAEPPVEAKPIVPAEPAAPAPKPAEPPKDPVPTAPPTPITPPPSPPTAPPAPTPPPPAEEKKDEVKHWVEYWDGTKTPKFKYEMRKGADGRWARNGYSQAFYASGVMEREGHYKNGVRVGQWKYYNPEGKLIRTEERGEGTPESPKL